MIPKPLKIYLCDLTYDTIILVSDTIPINIGFIGSYIKSKLGKKVEIELFKYPNDLLKSIKQQAPDMIGFSNYSWNSNLSEYFAGIAKKANPNCLVIQGGTNFPHETDQQKKFLLKRPNTDIYALFEGEKSALKTTERLIECSKNLKKFFKNPVDGCVFIDPNTRNTSDPKIVSGKYLERIKDLDEIPSPYLNGMLDKFFDGKLTPFLETNRGCPFTCSFCHTGADYYHKLNKFSEKRVQDEIDYVGEKCKKLGITNLHMADVNFGMYPQDKIVCEKLKDSKEKNNWPLHVIATTGKNSKKRVIEITSVLGKMFSPFISLQSMSQTVLQNIRRSNIRQSDMIAVNNHLRASGRSSQAELIVPLPGETKKSFIDGLNTVLDSHASSVTIYTLMMLYGTEFKTPSFREKHQYRGKFRIVPLNFGEYGGNKVFDFEEVGVQTKDLSFEDYLTVRSIALIVESLHNGKPFEEFFLYAKQFKIKPATFINYLYENVDNAPETVKKVFNEFKDETRNELWESEQELIDFYKLEKNYKLLKEGKVGGNLIYKYKSKSLTEAKTGWIEFIAEQLFNYLKEEIKEINLKKIKNEINEIKMFTSCKLEGLFQYESSAGQVKYEFEHDFIEWIDQLGNKDLSEFLLKDKKSYYFEFTKEQIDNRNDYFKRYGKDVNALSKIVTRISNLESQFRKIKNKEIDYLRDIYKRPEKLNTKYALAN